MKQLFRNLTAHFWLIPALMVAASIILAVFMTQIDRAISDDLLAKYPWLFSGTPDAARTMLSVIAAAAITVVSISFSITIIAMQQAATQYTTRVLRTFTSDTGNQTVLGVYLATFVFALLVLRAVRTEAESIASFVPVLSVTFAILLALVAIGVLVYFVNHISTSLQVTAIVSRVHENLVVQIDNMYPEQIGSGVKEPKPAIEIMKDLRKDTKSYSVKASRAGFINKIDEDGLEKIDTKHAKWVYVTVKVGDFVVKDETIAEIENRSPKDEDPHVAKKLGKAIHISNDRSTTQDILFAFRQLVDVALKSLSPGINDQTSAIYSIHYIGDGLRRICTRSFPENKRSIEGSSTKFVFTRPEWDTYINLAFTQIRNVSRDKVFVMGSLIDVLKDLQQLASDDRRPAIKDQLEKLEEQIKSGSFIESDQKELLGRLKLAKK